MMSFKEFLLSQTRDHADDCVIDLYNEYKLEYRKASYVEFFKMHREAEWFLEKYHPLLIDKLDQNRRQMVE
jgi:hypothetical protein